MDPINALRTARASILRGLSFYWRAVVRPHRGQALLILLLVAGAVLLETATISLAVPLLDAISHAEQASQSRVLQALSGVLEGWGLSVAPNVLVFALLVLACTLFVIRNVFLLVQQYVSNTVALKLRNETKTRLFEAFLRARYEETSRRARGRIVHQINEPSSAIYYALLALAQWVTGVLTCALMVALMFAISWWATVLAAVVPFFATSLWRSAWGKQSVQYGKDVYWARAEQTKVEVDALDGMKVVKAHGLEQRIVDEELKLLEQEGRARLKLVIFKYSPSLINEGIGGLIIISLGAVALLFPALGIRFSMLVAFLLAVRRIASSLSSLQAAQVQLGESRRALEMMQEGMQLPQERRHGRSVGPLETVRLADVRFGYAARPDHEVLRGLSLELRRGTVTALVGPTGSGKSTVANLLMDLYEPASGRILVNGVPLPELSLDAWRSRIGYVCQDMFVFNTTIRENIAPVEVVPDEAEIVRAAQVAQLHDFIRTLPDGYQTVVGDRGLRLSGGQCQRLALARAIVRRPQLLILDEATSALDSLTERAVYNAIDAIRRDAAVLVITHRLTTTKDADAIHVLQDGWLVESGTHASLLAAGKVYAALYEEAVTAKESPEASDVPVLEPGGP